MGAESWSWSPARRRRACERRALATQLPDIARSLARALAAGLPFDSAFARAAEAVDEPAAAVLRDAARRTRAGAVPERALAELGAVPGGPLIIGAIAISGELGGDLVHALAALAAGLGDRERLRGELRVATAQSRFAARVVPLVPVGALGLLAALSPATIVALTTTAPGIALLVTSGTLATAAFLLLGRIARAAS